MPFSRFVCWTADHAAEAIAVDATESSDAVFLATHHPAHILQRPPQQTHGGNPCTEEQVRELLLNDPADPLIIPVVGQSGSGKSHLVRWLKASLATADERLHVVHIPKVRNKPQARNREGHCGFQQQRLQRGSSTSGRDSERNR